MGISANMRKAIGMVDPKRSEGVTIPEAVDQVLTESGHAVDPEVASRAVRRRFTAGYKRRILQEADGCGAGVIAALLRREGLY